MSLTQKVRLELDDGRTVETSYDGRDLRAYEKKFRTSALTESMSLTMLTWLGHHAAVRTGAVNGDLSTYEAFDNVCISVEGVRDEPEVTEGPTKTPGRTRKKVSGD
jgi:hypothetical protein